VTRDPRLLLVARDRPVVRKAVERWLPGISFAFLEESNLPDPEGVEAVLLGSMAREGRGFEPSNYPRLAFVQRLFTGVDDLPFDRFPPRIEIASNAGGFAPFVAEHAVALALASARSLLEGQSRVAEGRLRPPPAVRTLRGQTAVILGFGAIGQGIAERLRPFGCTLEAVTRSGAPVPGLERVYRADQLKEALPRGAFVFEARPLTRATRSTIGAEELRAMPREGTLVNVGRAATVDEQALFDHLREVPTFRAAFDVWWGEDFAEGTLPESPRFAALPNFVGSPHIAGIAPGAEEYALTNALENLARYFRGERPRFLVDRSEYLSAP
jgi:D-3-phosphoglycerate dehydrogenase / 2-oxoglutarate reductase